MASGLQRNNQGPVGYGQPRRRVRRSIIMGDEGTNDQSFFEDDGRIRTASDDGSTPPPEAPPPPPMVPPAWPSNLPGPGFRNFPSAPSSTNDQAWRDSLRSSGFGSQGTLHGFRMDDYGGDIKARTSAKNVFAAIASRYPSTPEGLRQLVNDPDFRRAFPTATLVGGGAGDKIDFGDTLSDFESGQRIGIVDVGERFDPSNNTGSAWWWGHGAGGPQAPGNTLYNNAVPTRPPSPYVIPRAGRGAIPGNNPAGTPSSPFSNTVNDPITNQAMDFLDMLLREQGVRLG